jgi:hypothetical protein
MGSRLRTLRSPGIKACCESVEHAFTALSAFAKNDRSGRSWGELSPGFFGLATEKTALS